MLIKRQVLWVIVLCLGLTLLTACKPDTTTQNTSTPQPTRTPTQKPMSPEEVILAYFDAINTKNFQKSFDFQWQNWTETEKARSAECLEEKNVTYSSIDITPYTEFLATRDTLTQRQDQGDIEGQCERFMVSYWVDFVSGADGEYTFMCTLVFDQNAWKIIESGSPTSDSCTRAMDFMERSSHE